MAVVVEAVSQRLRRLAVAVAAAGKPRALRERLEPLAVALPALGLVLLIPRTWAAVQAVCPRVWVVALKPVAVLVGLARKAAALATLAVRPCTAAVAVERLAVLRRGALRLLVLRVEIPGRT